MLVVRIILIVVVVVVGTISCIIYQYYYYSVSDRRRRRRNVVTRTTATSFLQRRLPQLLSSVSSSSFIHDVLLGQFVVILYLFITLGCWSIVFAYIYPWMTQQNEYYHHHQQQQRRSSSSTSSSTMLHDDDATNSMIVIPLYHQYIGVLVFIACMMSWRLANQSSPGLIMDEPSSSSSSTTTTTTTIPYYNHFPYDDYMYCDTSNANDAANHDDANGNEPRSSSTAPTTTTTTSTSTTNNHRNTRLPSTKFKLPRSKYDRMKYHCFVAKYDHYCYWIHNTVGEENYRFFLLFLLVQVIMCVYGSGIIFRLLYNDIYVIHQLPTRTFIDRRHNDTSIPFSHFVLFQYVIMTYYYEVMVLAVLIVMSITLVLFLLYHIYITSCTGLTSNEVYKWSLVQQWYKSELKLYHQYQQRQQLTGVVAEDAEEKVVVVVEHPGPKPINIYNYGFVRNWKHVIYPISLHRKKRFEQFHQQRQQQQQQEQPKRTTTTISHSLVPQQPQQQQRQQNNCDDKQS